MTFISEKVVYVGEREGKGPPLFLPSPQHLLSHVMKVIGFTFRWIGG